MRSQVIKNNWQGSRVGEVVRARASHQGGPSSISWPNVFNIEAPLTRTASPLESYHWKIRQLEVLSLTSLPVFSRSSLISEIKWCIYGWWHGHTRSWKVQLLLPQVEPLTVRLAFWILYHGNISITSNKKYDILKFSRKACCVNVIS